MSEFYSLNFEIDIDPQKERSLILSMDNIGLRNKVDYWFERDDEQSRTILFVDIDRYVSYKMVSDIESFIQNDLSSATRSTTLITDIFSGDKNVYAIGPDSQNLESLYHRDRIEWHLRFLSNEDKDLVRKWIINDDH